MNTARANVARATQANQAPDAARDDGDYDTPRQYCSALVPRSFTRATTCLLRPAAAAGASTSPIPATGPLTPSPAVPWLQIRVPLLLVRGSPGRPLESTLACDILRRGPPYGASRSRRKDELNNDDALIPPPDSASSAHVEVSPDMGRLYVDGMSGLAYGPVLSKLYLYLDDPLKRTSETKFYLSGRLTHPRQ